MSLTLAVDIGGVISSGRLLQGFHGIGGLALARPALSGEFVSKRKIE